MTAQQLRRGRRLGAPLVLGLLPLAAGCVDVPDRALQPDMRRAADGGGAPMPDGGGFDARVPDARSLDPDAAVDLVDAGPIVDAHPSGVECPDPCPHPHQLAAYLSASRADAVEVLDDGSVLIAVALAADDPLLSTLEARGLAVEPSALIVPADLSPALDGADEGDALRPMLLHLDPDLSSLRGVLVPDGPGIGPIVDIWRRPAGEGVGLLYLVTRHGNGSIRFGAPLDGRGYAVLGPYSPPDVDGLHPEAHATVIDAAGAYQDRPPGAASRPGFVAVDGAPDAPGRSRARWFDGLGAPRPLSGLRHHVAGEVERYAFGAAPDDVRASTLPLRSGDRCALWTSADEPGGVAAFISPVVDGHGDERFGRRPLDAFADTPCPVPDPAPGEIADPPPAGSHGWSATAGRSMAVSGLVSTPDGSTVLGFDFAIERDGAARRVPAVAAYDARGALSWFQRLRPDALDGQPVVSEASQVVRGLAYDDRPGRASILVMAEGRPDDLVPLWEGPAAGGPGFQGAPRTPGGNAAAGWLGRLDPVDGALLAATWIYRPSALPRPEIMREGRLACFIDEAVSPGVPQRVQLEAGRIAVGPEGQVAVVGTGVGLENTPDALQQTDAPYGLTTSARFVRIYAPELDDLIYASALGPLPGHAAGHIGLDLEIGDLAFTAEGHLLVVGYQLSRDDDDDGVDDGATLPMTGVPAWADDGWPAEARGGERTRAFVLRLVPDPSCSP